MKTFLARLIHPCKTYRSTMGLLVAVLLFLIPGSILAVPAYEGLIFQVIQPDGTTLTLRSTGDERDGRYVTLDDYTVVQDSDGWHCYAKTDTHGELTATMLRASDSGMPTGLKNGVVNQIPKRLAATSSLPRPNAEDVGILDLGSLSGSDYLDLADVLVIMIKFPDEPTVYTRDDFDDLMNRPGFHTYGSVNQYYQEVSYGQFGINGIVVGWYTAAHNRAYYGYNNGSNWVAAAELAREAVVAAENAGTDFSAFDNDGDGEVDGLFIVHAGPGAETGNNGYPWSHYWCLSCAGLSPVSADGKLVNSYTMEPERLQTGQTTIGVFCHEFGHALGLPDLYDTDGSSNGIGSWCNMAGGTWNGGGAIPAHFSAWCKARLGWVTPQNITTDLWDQTISDVETNKSIYRLWSDGGGDDEYFLVEYRRQIGYDSLIPGCGVAIWHIDDSRTNNTDDTHRWVDLEEADRTENNSPGDLWLAKTFDSLTIPVARSYNGTNTKVKIIVKTGSCDSGGLVADLDIGNPPTCCLGGRGNVDADPADEISITDLTYVVDYLFSGGPAPTCDLEADINSDGGPQLNISDLTFLADFLFAGGPAPSACPLP